MNILKVTDPAFKKYGKVITNIDFSGLVEALASTPAPDSVVYEPSIAELEALPVFAEVTNKFYGEMPTQIGYCNGQNYLLNALEYHRSSEINVAGTDAILILGSQQDITDDFTYDTAKVEIFFLPKGCAVEIYATTLHYAPCSVGDNKFQVAIILPKDTNLPMEKDHDRTGEDKLITARNKWLIGHPEGGLDADAHIGLIGENICVK